MNTTCSADGTTIAFDQVGDGPALIYVHGAVQHRAIDQVGTDMAALLASQFTVITYDRRGRGASGDTQPYAVEREIEDLDALITAVGGSACVFGESSGAVLALEAALHGRAIDKLVCYEPPSSSTTPGHHYLKTSARGSTPWWPTADGRRRSRCS